MSRVSGLTVSRSWLLMVTLNLTQSHPVVTRTPTWETVAEGGKHKICATGTGDNEDVKNLRTFQIHHSLIDFDKETI